MATLADLESLDDAEVLAGYLEATRDDPEPGNNHTRSYWHGWRMRMNDMGVLPITDVHRQLVRQLAQRQRAQ